MMISKLLRFLNQVAAAMSKSQNHNYPGQNLKALFLQNQAQAKVAPDKL